MRTTVRLNLPSLNLAQHITRALEFLSDISCHNIRKMQSPQSSRISFLECLPAELSIKIFSYLGLNPREWISLLTLNRQIFGFLKHHEAALVHAASHPEDALDYSLVPQGNRTYNTFKAYFNLRKETSI